MAKQKGKRKTQKRSVILTVFFVLAVCYFVFNLFALNADLSYNKQELAQLNALLQEQENKNNALERVLESENEDELIERIAREELGYAYPNERIYAKSPAGVVPGQ